MLMPLFTTIDMIWLNDVLRANSKWTSQISYEVVASLLHKQFCFVVSMSFWYIAAEHIRALKVHNAVSNHDDRYDMVDCSAADCAESQLKLDLSKFTTNVHMMLHHCYFSILLSIALCWYIIVMSIFLTKSGLCA